MQYDCEGFRKLQELFTDLNFDAELREMKEKYPEEACGDFLKVALNRCCTDFANPMEDEDAPRLNENFANFFCINNLPQVNEEKKDKLLTVIVKLLSKKEILVEKDQIEMPFDGDKSVGIAFVEVESEARARLAANAINGFALDKKHTLAACQFDEFEKIKQVPDELVMPRAADLSDLKSAFTDLKRDQYLYQSSEGVHVNWHSQSQNQQSDSKVDRVTLPFQAQKQVNWSPQGTYLVQLSHDRIDFLGGSDMQPIITLMEAGVNHVSMSPCERYVLTYNQSSKKEAFIVWNFKLTEKIRSFEKEMFDKQDAYKWSFDGNYIAKKFNTSKRDELGNEVSKQGLSIYSLPTMELLEKEGVKKSHTINGIESFFWSPTQNMVCFSAFPEGSNQLPKIGFLAVPSRQMKKEIVVKDAEECTVVFHPQGFYTAIVIKSRQKKHSRFQVYVVDMRDKDLPVQIVLIQQEVLQYFGVFWEPNHDRLAFFANLKKVVEAGKKDYSNESGKNQVLLFEMNRDTNGFTVKQIGSVPSERIKSFQWAGSGGVFTIFEQEGQFQAASIFMITKEDVKDQVQQAQKKTKRGQVTYLKGAEEKYEFKKTSKFDTKENKVEGIWDSFGRFFAVVGLPKEKRDTNPKLIRFFNIKGEQLGRVEGVKGVTQFQWRPRPYSTLTSAQLESLKGEYKKKYNKVFKEEEREEKERMQAVQEAKNRKVRDEFLAKFFLPARREFEENIAKYQALWPVQAEIMEEEPQEFEVTHTFGAVVSERKVLNATQQMEA